MISSPQKAGGETVGGNADSTLLRWGVFAVAVVLFYGGLFLLFWPMLDTMDGGRMNSGSVAMGIIGTPLEPLAVRGEGDHVGVSIDGRVEYLGFAAGWLIALLALAVMFIWPLNKWEPRRAPPLGPIVMAAIGAGFGAALVTVALVAIVMEIPHWWESMMFATGVWPATAALVVAWGLWSGWCARAWRRGVRLDTYGRAVRWMLIGALAAVLVGFAVQWVVPAGPSRAGWARGSYSAEVLGGVALVWAMALAAGYQWLRGRSPELTHR